MSTLPIHGFVLAGGQSSRMGRDKALAMFCGEPMIAIAVRTLCEICEAVCISGNRSDLASYAPIIHEIRLNEGPVAGIEAALAVATRDWAMFIPVDTPLLPAAFLQAWATAAMARPGMTASYIRCGDDVHPTVCLIQRSNFALIASAVAEGQRRILRLLENLPGLWVADATDFASYADAHRFLLNLNTPEDLAAASKL